MEERLVAGDTREKDRTARGRTGQSKRREQGAGRGPPYQNHHATQAAGRTLSEGSKSQKGRKTTSPRREREKIQKARLRQSFAM